MQQISVEGLPLEKQFELTKALQKIDAMEDIEYLKDFTKDIIRLSLIKEKEYEELRQQAIQMNEGWLQRNEGLIAIINKLEQVIQCLVLRS